MKSPIASILTTKIRGGCRLDADETDLGLRRRPATASAGTEYFSNSVTEAFRLRMPVEA